jgi:hypothetical protein
METYAIRRIWEKIEKYSCFDLPYLTASLCLLKYTGFVVDRFMCSSWKNVSSFSVIKCLDNYRMDLYRSVLRGSSHKCEDWEVITNAIKHSRK